MRERLAQEEIDTVLLFQLPDPEKNAAFLSAMSPRGVITVGPISNAHLKQIKSHAIPVVMIDPYHYDENDTDLVRANNFAIGARAAAFAIASGHKRLTFVGNPTYSVSFRNRYEGFLSYAQAYAGEGVTVTLLADGSRDRPVCDSDELEALLLSGSRPSLAFCGNDYSAFQLYKAALAHDITVPDALSIIGCDHVAYRNAPAFTTFDLSPAQFGISAAELLLRRFAHPACPALYLQIVPTFLPAQTTAPPSDTE